LPWLRVAGREGWIVVTGDRHTLLGELVLLVKEGQPSPGFAIVGAERLADIGWISRKLAQLESRLSDQRAADIQVFL
jgi:hypothetical protein